MNRPKSPKNKNRILIVALVAILLFTAIISASASLENSGPVERRVNIPYLGSGPPVEFFEPAIFWFGQITPTINNADVRLWYYDDYVKVVVHVVDRFLWYDESPTAATLEEWDAVTLFLNLDGSNGSSPSPASYRLVSQLRAWQAEDNYKAAYSGNGSAWVEAAVPFTAEASWRGDFPNNIFDDRGWQLTYVIPFASLGLTERPAEGTKWGLSVAVHDRDEALGSPVIVDQVWPEMADGNAPATWAEINFGIPVYSPPVGEPQGSTTIRQGLNGAEVVDGHVGSLGNCSGDLDDWTTWGDANWGGWDQINIQNQWDISDFSCFSKFFVTFPLDAVPPGKSILEASFSMTMFGNAGGGDYVDPQDSYIQVFTVAEDWDEQTLNWNNAPYALENISGTWVQPVQTSDQRTYDWDVYRALTDAYQQGEPLRLALYSADGDYHSGKYFWSSDGIDWNPSQRPTLRVVWGDDCVDCGTSTPVPPTSTSVPPTSTPIPPTSTSVPPTSTSVPPTSTSVPPTSTPIPPTSTSVPPTTTPVPGSEDAPIYISPSSYTTLGGLSFADEDIAIFDPASGSWSVLFDGSDVGLGDNSDQNIDAFHILKDGTILFSLLGDTEVPGVGSIDDSDIIQFVPTSLGSSTSGSFNLYFDGSDVGLTKIADDIDALTLLTGGDLIVSTIGHTNVAGFRTLDEDLLRFSPTSLGQNTAGIWSLYFDGSDIGLGNSPIEDIWGAWINVDGGEIYFTTMGAFSAQGISGDGADIIKCQPTSLGEDSSCILGLLWDGSANGLDGEVINGFALRGVDSEPPINTPVPPTNTSVPPTSTSVPPTSTSVPPTSTPVPPTSTSVPPTSTSVPPTSTPVPPTSTSVPPTSTTVPPTSTAVPPTSTAVPPTSTPESPSPTATPNGSTVEFFLSPAGNDIFSGASPEQAWATFERAWLDLKPGDTLTLLDGVYYQSIHPQRIGEIGNQVTIRAQNDGKAIIDGQNVRIPVHVESYRQSYLIIEGIVARNGNRDVYNITGDHNVLRRVSGYDSDTDGNSRVFSIGGEYNLVEDCVAAGSGRKMILIRGQHNTIRRCVADWREWDGRNWHDCWPWGEGIELYNASFNIIENSIAYGHTPRAAISLLSQGGVASNGNKILGSMAVHSGMQVDGTPMVWGDTRPQPSEYTCVAKIYEWPQYMSGFALTASGGIMHDNLLQDILAWGNARYGLTFYTPSTNDISNNRLNRATVFNNGLNNPNANWGGVGAGAKDTELANFNNITNSSIENIYDGSTFNSQSGEGARLTNRYVDGVLTGEPLWPWPMEDRIQAELGYSVTEIMTDIISQSP